MVRRLGAPGGALALFGVASLGAVAIGAFVCASRGLPDAVWMRNLAAWAVGALAAIGIFAAWRPGASLAVALWAAPAGLLASFLFPDQQGVHRWVDLGPLNVNVAMLLLPAAAVAFAALAWEHRSAWVAAFLSLALLVVQPDASQAAALAAVIVLVALNDVPRPAVRIGAIAGAVVLAGLAWLRPDPLQPVAEVEQIVGLAFGVSPFAGGMALLLLLAVAAAPAVSTAASPHGRLEGWALGLLLLLWAAASFLRPFPVPLVGLGMSPIVGAWLGAGLLAGLLRPQAEAARDANARAAA